MADSVAVRVEPLGSVVSVDPGESLLEAAWRAGLEWPTVCYGQAQCMVCGIEVVSGHDSIVPADGDETAAMRSRLPRSQARGDVRLACRIRFSGTSEVVVRKPGVRLGERTP